MGRHMHRLLMRLIISYVYDPRKIRGEIWDQNSRKEQMTPPIYTPLDVRRFFLCRLLSLFVSCIVLYCTYCISVFVIFFLIGFSSPKLAICFAQLCTNQNVTISRKGPFCTVMGPALGFFFAKKGTNKIDSFC